MFPALGSLLAKSVAPAVAEQLARSGFQVLQARLRRDPSLAPATSAEVVAAVNHYNAAAERAWTRERLFAFVAFFVSAGPDGTIRWIESPARIVDYVLRGPRPGEDDGDRSAVVGALESEMETVRELMARYLDLLATAPATDAAEASATDAGEASANDAGEPRGTALLEPAVEPAPAVQIPADPSHARLNELLARVKTPAGAAFSSAAHATRDHLSRVQQTARNVSAARKARALVEQSFKLLHAGGVGLAQAETYLLRKGLPAEVVRSVVAERVAGG